MKRDTKISENKNEVCSVDVYSAMLEAIDRIISVGRNLDFEARTGLDKRMERIHKLRKPLNKKELEEIAEEVEANKLTYRSYA